LHTWRITCLTNAFSKQVENHAHTTAIIWTYYKGCRVHMTLKKTPATAVGPTNRR